MELHLHHPQPDTVRLALHGEVTIYQASALKTELLDALTAAQGHDCTRYELDLQAVTELDSAGVQLLLMVLREVQRLQKPLHTVAASATAREVLDFYRLGTDLNLAAAQP
ncbi:MAG: STAS domain-containing protein [Comamonas sp.]|nr:STAS domain-containing protein [Comamonas sp.]